MQGLPANKGTKELVTSVEMFEKGIRTSDVSLVRDAQSLTEHAPSNEGVVTTPDDGSSLTPPSLSVDLCLRCTIGT